MLKVLVLHGSPRKDGNSDTLAKYFIAGMKEEVSAEVKHFYPNEMNIKPCQGCFYCRTSENHHCAIQDSMSEVYEAHKEADVVVFATPMYWGYMTAQLKTVIDRMESLAWSKFGGRTFVVLITYHHHCESTVAFFERIAPFFKIDLHTITCRTLNEETFEDMPIANFKDRLEEAFKLGKKLAEK